MYERSGVVYFPVDWEPCNMKFLSISFSLDQLPDPSPTFRLFPDFPISRLGGDYFRIIISESHFIEDSQKKKT